MIIPVPALDDLPRAAALIAPIACRARVVAIHGHMGAGKTTLIKALCRAIGVRDTVVSPTFALINEYRDDRGQPVFHFDCYRLEGPDDACRLGCEDYFYSGALCLIEWPEKIAALLPPQTLHLYISVLDGEQRQLKL